MCVHAQIDTINTSGYFLFVIKWLNEYTYEYIVLLRIILSLQFSAFFSDSIYHQIGQLNYYFSFYEIQTVSFERWRKSSIKWNNWNVDEVKGNDLICNYTLLSSVQTIQWLKLDLNILMHPFYHSKEIRYFCWSHTKSRLFSSHATNYNVEVVRSIDACMKLKWDFHFNWTMWSLLCCNYVPEYYHVICCV